MNRSTIRAAAQLPLRAIPAWIRRRMTQALIGSFTALAPRDALRWLFTIDDDLSASLNEAATRHDRGIHAKHRLTRYHDFFVERIHEGETVVDIGCGNGALAFSIASRARAEVTGIDIEPSLIAEARSAYELPNLTFVVGDVLRDLPSRTFDTVVLSNVLEHIDERPAFLMRVQQALGPKRWLIRVPMYDRDWRIPLRQEIGVPYLSDPTHFTEYTRDSFTSEMATASLDVVHLQVNWGEIWAEVRPS